MHKKMPINAELTLKQHKAIQWFILFRQHILMHGLAGTGKSYQIDKIISDALGSFEISSRNVLAFTFDRKLAKKYRIDFSWSNKNNTFTIHSFCFKVLESLNFLPKSFTKATENGKGYKFIAEDYDELISGFLKLTSEQIISSPRYLDIRRIKLITLDEVQDFREDYVEVVKRIKELGNNPSIIIAGDMNQKIYEFQDKHSKKKLSNVLKEPELLFGKEEHESIGSITNSVGFC